MRQLVIFLLVLFAGLFFTSAAEAAPRIDYPNYDVFIEIKNDSAVIVEETITQRFNGVSNGARRDLTLNNPQKKQFCEQNNLVCGGFSQVILLGVYDKDGNELGIKDGFRKYEVTDSNGTEYLRFEWKIWDEEYQKDTVVTWKIRYLLLGSLNWLKEGGITSNKTETLVPYFYWNAIPEERAGNIQNASVQIKFPDSVKFSQNRFKVFSDYSFEQSFDKNTNKLTLNLQKNLGKFGDFTVAYEFRNNEIVRPASVTYSIRGPLLLARVLLDGIKMDSGFDGVLEGIPAGKHKLLFQANGFEDYSVNLDLQPGENFEIEVRMERTFLSEIVFYISILMCGIGLIFTPLGILLLIYLYRKKGRDKNMPKTIIPEFVPPENLPPYLLGSLKDEKVDKKDVVGSIIDLAYRGYIKIKETSPKKYKLIKLKDDISDLSDAEQDIMNAIFQNNNNEVNLDSIRYTFPLKYHFIVKKIYEEMKQRGYFKESPNKTRLKYIFISNAILVASVGFIFLGTLILSFITNFPIFFSLPLPSLLFGFGLLLISRYMPSKTSKGSEVFAKILGFKMYLETAERYSLQNLKPEDFERYLSYAIVFGIEKKWAQKFKDIYNQTPSWYEGSGSISDPIIFASMLNSFTNQTVSATSPQTSSSRGGGWSGGSSFGGFSGGGGGGGSAGGW
ncbi:MAG: hypothetical protein KatS3mg085_831 [Candidatus Dojkabacteria bacterium]|nr:MAG: hypothetical protein KatS3mg085_831 [Candidatus Dojkabacteria bacterium]